MKPDCARCGGAVEHAPRDEALSELAVNFPGIPLSDCVLVCRGCYAVIIWEISLHRKRA